MPSKKVIPWKDEKAIAQWLTDELAGDQKSHYFLESTGLDLILTVEINEDEPNVWGQPVSEVAFLMERHDHRDWIIYVKKVTSPNLCAEKEAQIQIAIYNHLSLLTGGGTPRLNGSHLPINTVEGIGRVMATIWEMLTEVIPYSGIKIGRGKNEITTTVYPQIESRFDYQRNIKLPPLFPRQVDIREMKIRIVPNPDLKWTVTLASLGCLHPKNETLIAALINNLEYGLEDNGRFRLGFPFDPKRLWPKIKINQHLHVTN